MFVRYDQIDYFSHLRYFNGQKLTWINLDGIYKMIPNVKKLIFVFFTFSVQGNLEKKFFITPFLQLSRCMKFFI